MTRWLGSLITCLIATTAGTARAGQTEYTSTLLAWSRDGSSVLLVQHGVHGSRAVTELSSDYTIASAVEARMTLQVTNTLGTGVESVSVAECTNAAKQLAKALVARGFTGVSVSPAACKRADREVVKVSGTVGDPSWVQLPQGREATALELTAWELVKRAVPKYTPFLPHPACASSDAAALDSAVDVATKTGALVVVMEAESPCEALHHTTVHIFRRTGAGYEEAE